MMQSPDIPYSLQGGKLGIADAPAFEQFFAETKASTLRLATLLCPAAGMAEEVVQDAYIKILMRWGHLDTPEAYLRRCVINGSNSLLRRVRRERRYLTETSPAVATPDPLPELLDILGHLSKRRRQVVVLRFYSQMTIPEIARALRLSQGTAKSTLHDAIQQLKGMLNER